MKRSHLIPDPLLVIGKPYCKGSCSVAVASLIGLALFLIWHWLSPEELPYLAVPLVVRHVWRREKAGKRVALMGRIR